jgi:hypothetical protein
MTFPTDKRFAKDVAREIERRRLRRRLLLWLVLLGAVVLAAMYATCGSGWGLGGNGKGKGEGDGTNTPQTAVGDAQPKRCTIRIAAAGITVDGAKATREQAVKKCKATAGADVTVTGGAKQGDFDELRGALEAAGISFRVIDASSGSNTPNWAPKL